VPCLADGPAAGDDVAALPLLEDLLAATWLSVGAAVPAASAAVKQIIPMIHHCGVWQSVMT
jgi:hypothetical protein